MWSTIFKIFTGDLIGRAFDLIDNKVKSGAERESLKAGVVRTWLQNRMAMPWYVDFCFIGPLAFWWGMICLYNVFWWNGPEGHGIWPQDWKIAALPSPLDEWAGWIILSRFGVGLVTGYLNRK